MDRHSFAFTVRKGQLGSFLQKWAENWDRIRQNAEMAGITNFSLWNVDEIFLGYYERAENCTLFVLKPIADVLQAYCSWISDPGQDMPLMYEDYGIVRADKSMIRHRVFVTKLLQGDKKEYKRRHDGLKNSRTEPDPGPDSNFSIWNAGMYIFGYDEIDTSMEHEMTLEEREDTIRWEKHMLDIMEWVTDDTDWITGEHHSRIKRICWLP